MEKFRFRFKIFWNKSKRFCFVTILSSDIGTFVVSFRYRWHYYPGQPAYTCMLSYSIVVSHLSFNFLCLLLLYSIYLCGLTSVTCGENRKYGRGMFCSAVQAGITLTKRLVGRVSKVSSFVGLTRPAGCIQIIRMWCNQWTTNFLHKTRI